MERIAEMIKTLAVEAVEAQKPSAIMFGLAESGDEIVVDDKLWLSKPHLEFMNGVQLKEGDKVILLRENGGQRFVVLGVVD